MRFFLVLGLLIAQTASVADPGVLLPQAQARLHSLSRDGVSWNLPASLGRHYVSQAYLFERWLDTSSLVDTVQLRRRLWQSQRKDGSWEAQPDSRASHGDLNGTFLNYWALRALGESISSPEMARARQWILAHGGIPKLSLFSKILLALHGNYPWSNIPRVPSVLFSKLSPVRESHFGQWIGPHLLPLSYLRQHEVIRRIPGLELPELGATRHTPRPFRPSQSSLVIERLLSTQQPAGSWGAYGPATWFAVATLTEHQSHVGISPRMAGAISRGLGFLRLLLHTLDTEQDGVLMDGRYWDTALAAAALVESGVEPSRLTSTGRYLAAAQTKEGGFPFGLDFSYAPDTDDTAVTLVALSKFPDLSLQRERAATWLRSMQNSDGGYGAFARNNNGGFLVSWLAKPFADSAELFDESSADVTGHVLEGLATVGSNRRNSPTVRKAVAYLRSTQKPFGAWQGRWAVNYLYGTSAALVGLGAIGVPPQESFIRRAAAWLSSKQNADGGFGESSLSYSDISSAGVGSSTPSQTAWALMGLMGAGLGRSSAAERAARFLEQWFIREGKWTDPWAVGTGHRGLAYMTYPSYPEIFPLWALGRYSRLRR